MPTLSPAPSLTLSPVSTTSGNLIHRPFAGGLLSPRGDARPRSGLRSVTSRWLEPTVSAPHSLPLSGPSARQRSYALRRLGYYREDGAGLCRCASAARISEGETQER